MEREDLILRIETILKENNIEDFEYNKDGAIPELKKVLKNIIKKYKKDEDEDVEKKYCYTNIVFTAGKFCTKDGKKFKNVKEAAKHNATLIK